MRTIKLYTQQHNEIYDMTNNLKITISVRGGELTFFVKCLLLIHDKDIFLSDLTRVVYISNPVHLEQYCAWVIDPLSVHSINGGWVTAYILFYHEALDLKRLLHT